VFADGVLHGLGLLVRDVGVLGLAGSALVQKFAEVDDCRAQRLLGLGPSLVLGLTHLDGIARLLQLAELVKVHLMRRADMNQKKMRNQIF
jgi:hypothetical protein